MASPLLETKFYVPRRRGGVVSRPRLGERLSRAREATLTLVSAPAGFGKTTLLAQWIASTAADERHVAWLSLDQRDNDPVSFWTYVIGALQTVAPDVGVDAWSLLHSSPPPIETVLLTLLNELAALPMDVVLVLDDYHAVDAPAVQDGMLFLLEHLPPRLHLVIATRSDPSLPLARLRARGELVEIRAADLRFTPYEAGAYLNDVMRLDLSAQHVSALEGRTEGWIAALQLAALSMQGRDDVAEFVASFAGDDRYIVDYLLEEVLLRQPDEVRGFLLQTSILDRLSGPLCDAVTEVGGGKAMLEALERGNLFVVPLDDRRRWYRYHHLFADVLRTRLLDEQPDHLHDLHRRASEWFEQNGEPSESIRHALAALDFPRAADLVERAMPGLLRNRQEATLLAWLRALPRELFCNRPVLSDAYAGALLSNGELEGVEDRLQDAERWLETTTAANGGSAEMVVVDHAAFHRLPGSLAMHRAGLALRLGHLAATVDYARRTLDLVAEDDHIGHGAASALLGLAAWAGGDLEAGHQAYVEAMTRLRRAGHISDVLGCAIVLADIRIAQGRLREAMRTYEQALQLASEQGAAGLRGTADMYVGLSELHRERNDLDAARQALLTSQGLGEHTGLPQNAYRVRVATARLREAEGDLDGALELLDEAERRYTSDFSPHVRPIPALKARLLVRQGRLDAALDWAHEQGLSGADDISYAREFEHITLARLLLAQRSVPEAQGLLARLLVSAEVGARTGSVVEILLLRALAHHLRGDTAAALLPLGRALALAEPEGYVRIFVDEGRPMAALLQAAAKHDLAPDYVRLLLASFGTPTVSRPARQALVEPLSERELDVLRLLASDLDGPDIANELVVSLSTMRTHTRNIYSKLGVTNRRAAVRRAEELALL